MNVDKEKLYKKYLKLSELNLATIIAVIDEFYTYTRYYYLFITPCDTIRNLKKLKTRYQKCRPRRGDNTKRYYFFESDADKKEMLDALDYDIDRVYTILLYRISKYAEGTKLERRVLRGKGMEGVIPSEHGYKTGSNTGLHNIGSNKITRGWR